MHPKSIGVVIPARNEAREILGCLTAIDDAVRMLHRRFPQVSVQVYVVADGCTDDTVELVQARQGSVVPVQILTIQEHNVGKARAFGVQRFLADVATEGLVQDQTWIAVTDADSRVPSHWLVSQLQHASSGVDCVVGTVEPRAETATQRLIHAWFARHTLGENHPHIFGANLAVRGSWYTRDGGFRPLTTGEDVALVEALTLHGARVLATDSARVVTSARRIGRVSDGFSTYCRSL